MSMAALSGMALGLVLSLAPSLPAPPGPPRPASAQNAQTETAGGRDAVLLKLTQDLAAIPT
ncbi:MAG: hypothetical protein ACJ8AT_38370 [Hyalangium sp.]|uniref:hypothetical protein n=1 Tax=Hyalangium sp. TaxID=2028555 RepID=UPI00389B0A47